MLLQCRPGLVPGEAGEVKARQLASSCGVPPCAVPKPNELPPLAQPRRAGSTQQGATKTEKTIIAEITEDTLIFAASVPCVRRPSAASVSTRSCTWRSWGG